MNTEAEAYELLWNIFIVPTYPYIDFVLHFSNYLHFIRIHIPGEHITGESIPEKKKYDVPVASAEIENE